MGIMDIELNDREDKILVQLTDGSTFVLECRQLTPTQKKKNMGGARVCWMLNQHTK